MSTQSETVPSLQATHPELNTASVSAAVFSVVTPLHFLLKSVGYTALSSGLFLVSVIALGTFTVAMMNLIIDDREVFSMLVGSYNLRSYAVQASAAVIIGLGVFAIAQTSSFSGTSHLFALTVVYLTMVGVIVWFAQETLSEK